MLIHKAFCYKLRPTPTQESLFWRYAGACRWVWNHMLAENIRAYREEGLSLTAYDQMKHLTQLKRVPETAWLREIQAQILQQSIARLHLAFRAFFEQRAGFPRFKSRARGPHSFTFPQNVIVEPRRVRLPKGWLGTTPRFPPG